MKVGIFGAGFSGKRIGNTFFAKKFPVWGTTREESKFSALQATGIDPVLFDGEHRSKELEQQLADTTHLIISIAPPRAETDQQADGMVDPVLIALADHALPNLMPKLEWIAYLSTVGVYGNHDGAWVDEQTPVKPVSERSRQRVRAEAEWMAAGEANNVPVGVFRLSGIYGPGRNGLATAKSGKSRRMIKPGQVFNRIHVDDIAEAVFLASQMKADGLFNITDDEPAPPQDVVTFAHKLLGTEPPTEIDFKTADISPMARSFYGENKRVSNRQSKAVLGLNYAYPDYRSALTRMWNEENW